MTLNCLANDWKKDEYRYSLELSKSKTPQNTILVVGVNPGGQTTPKNNILVRPFAVCANS